ncbi:MAG: hypothetical protein KC501_05260 [Myxococcales bacterium]|nr:hypothetical protein [Myxococcales bacterium]
MRTNELVLMAMTLVAPMLGCGDDANPGGSGDGSSGSTGAASDSTTGSNDESGTAAGTVNMEGGESSSSGEPPVEVTVEGRVIDFLLEAPIPGSEISIYDDDTLMTTADDMGLFSLGPFQPDTGALFVLAPNADYWGAIIPIDIGSDPLQEDVELTQISNDIVDMQIMGLMDQMPAIPDLDQAIIVVRLRNNTAVSEGPTTIEMMPPPPDGTYYAPDAMGAPILNQNTIEFPVLPVVVYFNVPDTAPGAINFTASHPTRECTVLYPDLPTSGRHMTLVEVECL